MSTVLFDYVTLVAAALLFSGVIPALAVSPLPVKNSADAKKYDLLIDYVHQLLLISLKSASGQKRSSTWRLTPDGSHSLVLYKTELSLLSVRGFFLVLFLV